MTTQIETLETPATSTASKTPRHLKRASSLRTKTNQFNTDFKLLEVWQRRDKTGTVDQILTELKSAQASLENAAALYETLTSDVTQPQRGKSNKISAGMTVQVKEKHVATYEALTNGQPVNCLKVIQVRDTHAVIETPSGERMFVAMKELEPADEEVEEAEAAE